jgi:hypothetical protein
MGSPTEDEGLMSTGNPALIGPGGAEVALLEIVGERDIEAAPAPTLAGVDSLRPFSAMSRATHLRPILVPSRLKLAVDSGCRIGGTSRARLRMPNVRGRPHRSLWIVSRMSSKVSSPDLIVPPHNGWPASSLPTRPTLPAPLTLWPRRHIFPTAGDF